MKKVLSLILVVCMAFSCLALSACVWEGIWQTTTSTVPTTSTTQPTTKPTSTTATTTTTTTTIPDDGGEPVDLVVQHGDNFTEDDIKFVKSFHGYQDMIAEEFLFSFSEMIDTVREGKWYLYYASVDIDNPHYICGYIDISTEENLNEWASGCIDVTKYIWYKFDADEDVPEEIGDLSIGWVFHTYDAVITKDIGNGIDLEHKFKYYSIGRGGIWDVIEIYEYMLIHYYKPIDEFVGIEDIRRSSRCYRGYTTTDGKDYFVLRAGNSLNEDGTISNYLDQNKKQLGDCYDALLPYFERIEEMDDMFTNSSGETFKRLYYGIPLDIIANQLIHYED